MALNFMPFLPPQASPQAQQAIQQQPQTMQTMAAPQSQPGNAYGLDRRQLRQDWRAQRPQMAQGMDQSQFHQQMQDWRALRPQFGGMNRMPGQMGQMPMTSGFAVGEPSPMQVPDLAARHAAMLQQARPQTMIAPAQQTMAQKPTTQVMPAYSGSLLQRKGR